MNLYKHILFDLDGTLSDPSKGIINSLKKTLDVLEVSYDPTHDFGWVIGPTLDFAFSRLLETDKKEVLENSVRIFREYYKDGGLFENDMFPAVPAFLENLRKNSIKSYVATSKPQWFADPILEKFEIHNQFTEVCGSLKESRKSKEDIIEYIITNHRLDPNDCLMIGDRKFDILGARKHGINSVGVNFGFAEQGELEEAQPSLIVDDFDQLADFILSNSN